MPCPAEELRRYGHWDLDLSPAEFITERMSQVSYEISRRTFFDLLISVIAPWNLSSDNFGTLGSCFTVIL